MGILTITVGLIRRVTGERDRHGNPVVSFADPVALPVLGIAPRTRDEPRTQNRPEAVSTVWDIYAPLGTVVSPYDRVVLPSGEVCEVVGEVGVWDHNPHTSVKLHGGVQFTVQRKQG